MIIQRPSEVASIAGSPKWVLVYGRRKTGKTFLVRNFVKHDEYHFVKRDRSVAGPGGGPSLAYDTLIEVLSRALDEGKTVVVDEFHRLGDDFLDFIQGAPRRGKLILVSSTLHLSRRVFSARSPVLGLVTEAPVGLIRLEDTLAALRGRRLSPRHLLELAIVLREPIAVDYLAGGAGPRAILVRMVGELARTIPALVGEVFIEEERNISAIYEGILRAVASGKVVSGEISSHLFSRRVVPKDDPSVIQPYLGNLLAFGLLKRLPVLGKKRFVYKHVSSLVRLYFYADEKYNIGERRTSELEMGRIVDEMMPRLVEDEVREFLADRFGLSEAVAEGADFEIDGCLLRFGKPEVAIEVKWGGAVDRQDVASAERNLGRLAARRRILMVADKRAVPATTLEVADIRDFLGPRALVRPSRRRSPRPTS